MIPPVLILRIRSLLASTTKMLPDESIPMPSGPENVAEMAGPPSPEKPLVPGVNKVPSTVRTAETS
jgi:hypothetical protein